MRPGRIVAQVHVFEELPLGIRGRRNRTRHCRIAEIGEFMNVAFTAEGARNPHRKASMQVRLGALALLVDQTRRSRSGRAGRPSRPDAARPFAIRCAKHQPDAGVALNPP